MRPISPKAVGRQACLRTKNPPKLLKDLRPKKRLNILMKEESKEVRDSMKTEDGSVHRNRYNGHCMKQ
jgi:hypothetical protein